MMRNDEGKTLTAYAYPERREAIYGPMRAEGIFTWDCMYDEEYALACIHRIDRGLHRRMQEAAERLGGIFAKTVAIVQQADTVLLEELGVPEAAVAAVRLSFGPLMPSPTVIGRFDFAADEDRIKMLEFNSDTPTGIVEAFHVNGAVCSVYGAEDPNAGCTHRLAESFRAAIAAYQDAGYETRHIYFSALDWHIEDAGTTRYLLRTSGLAADFAPLSDLRVKDDRLWVRLADDVLAPVDVLYRLHALEKLAEDRDEDGYPTGEHTLRLIAERKLAVINPPSGFAAQTKALQALIWNLHEAQQFYTPEEHAWIEAYMLPTYLENRFAGTGTPYVVKPIYGREGSGVTIFGAEGQTIERSEEEEYCDQPMVYQRYTELPQVRFETLKGAGSGRLLWGCFLIGGRASAVVARVGGHITNNGSYYLPVGFI
ncbi:glutathionylspermidine synthase family protein [Paenibacillus konkukensis]|nr:glutathionylspermidine synthase family protein [Paenibacillus konkukensis]